MCYLFIIMELVVSINNTCPEMEVQGCDNNFGKRKVSRG